MAAQITQTLAKPATTPPRAAPSSARPTTSGPDGESRAPATTTTQTRSADRPALRAQDGRRPPEPPASRASDRVELQTRDPRETARTLQSQGQAVSRLQSAGQKVDAGVRDLQRLGQLAQQSAEADDTADRAALDDEAREIDGRLAETDRDPDVQNAREALRQASLERNANQARTEANRLGRQAEQANRPEDRRPPTLVLEARQPDGDRAEQRAAQANQEARAAERAASRERDDAEGAPGADLARQTPAENRPERRETPSLRPAQADVSSRESARATQAAANEAESRATRFREDIGRAEAEAARTAEKTAQQAAQSGDGRRLTTEAEGRQTADRVRQTAQREPRRFVDAQARVNADAAARLLA